MNANETIWEYLDRLKNTPPPRFLPLASDILLPQDSAEAKAEYRAKIQAENVKFTEIINKTTGGFK